MNIYHTNIYLRDDSSNIYNTNQNQQEDCFNSENNSNLQSPNSLFSPNRLTDDEDSEIEDSPAIFGDPSFSNTRQPNIEKEIIEIPDSPNNAEEQSERITAISEHQFNQMHSQAFNRPSDEYFLPDHSFSHPSDPFLNFPFHKDPLETQYLAPNQPHAIPSILSTENRMLDEKRLCQEVARGLAKRIRDLHEARQNTQSNCNDLGISTSLPPQPSSREIGTSSINSLRETQYSRTYSLQSESPPFSPPGASHFSVNEEPSDFSHSIDYQPIATLFPNKQTPPITTKRKHDESLLQQNSKESRSRSEVEMDKREFYKSVNEMLESNKSQRIDKNQINNQQQIEDEEKRSYSREDHPKISIHEIFIPVPQVNYSERKTPVLESILDWYDTISKFEGEKWSEIYRIYSRKNPEPKFRFKHFCNAGEQLIKNMKNHLVNNKIPLRLFDNIDRSLTLRFRRYISKVSIKKV